MSIIWVSSLIGSPSRLGISAQTSPYLFCYPSGFIFNSHKIKTESFLAYFMRILNSCVVMQVFKLSTLMSAISVAHLLCSIAPIWQDIRTPWWFCSCKLPCCSAECVLLSCFNAMPDIFAVMHCFTALWQRWVLCSALVS